MRLVPIVPEGLGNGERSWGSGAASRSGPSRRRFVDRCAFVPWLPRIVFFRQLSAVFENEAIQLALNLAFGAAHGGALLPDAP
jgi:hypothetical protein